MEKRVDKRERLTEEPFSYQSLKDDKVFLLFHGKRVTVLSGDKARRFVEAINGLDGKEAQLFMAKATGHFKHGNEKSNRQ